ncbi:MAG TPA: hypothetical protein VMW32_10535 [Bacteroidales bacterium]|nr:hypothetical protein [Bacteroidales bacterium]
MIFQFPDVYSLAVSSSCISNQPYCRPCYQKRFMGLPNENFGLPGNELVGNKKRFFMMSYPNRNHQISESENTTYHLFDLHKIYNDTYTTN